MKATTLPDWRDREADADRNTDNLRNAMIANAFLAAALGAFGAYQHQLAQYAATTAQVITDTAVATGAFILSASAFVAMISLAAIRTMRDINRR